VRFIRSYSLYLLETTGENNLGTRELQVKCSSKHTLTQNLGKNYVKPAHQTMKVIQSRVKGQNRIAHLATYS